MKIYFTKIALEEKKKDQSSEKGIRNRQKIFQHRSSRDKQNKINELQRYRIEPSEELSKF